MPDPGNGKFFRTPCAAYAEAGRQCRRSADKAREEVSVGKGSRFLDWAGGKVDDVWRWIEKKLGKAGVEDNLLTGTVWDNINPTQPNIKGTEIPQSFEIIVDGETFWVHPNGTKHMGEYITRNAMSHGMPMNSQAILTSFQNAVNTACEEGIRYEQLMKVGDWELIFSRPRTEGLLPVIKHALYVP